MDISSFLVVVISFLGLLLGIIVVYIAPEEQRPLRRYVQKAKLIFFYGLALVSTFIYPPLLLLFIASYYLQQKKNNASYWVLGGTFIQPSLVIPSLLIFYGVCIGILETKRSKKNWTTLLRDYSPFILIGWIASILPLLTAYA